MANNYTETSFVIEMQNKDEQEEVMQIISDLSELSEEGSDADLKNSNQEVLDLASIMELDEFGLGFSAEPDGEKGIWFCGEESVNVEQLAEFIFYIVKKFKTRPASFMWADYCSKPRLDEQGGGAVFITQEEVKWMSTYSWVVQMENEYATSLN